MSSRVVCEGARRNADLRKAREASLTLTWGDTMLSRRGWENWGKERNSGGWGKEWGPKVKEFGNVDEGVASDEGVCLIGTNLVISDVIATHPPSSFLQSVFVVVMSLRRDWAYMLVWCCVNEAADKLGGVLECWKNAMRLRVLSVLITKRNQPRPRRST